MTENYKVYNLESFTEEERERVEALIKQIEEKKNKKKWWIVPKYNYFEKMRCLNTMLIALKFKNTVIQNIKYR